MNNAEKKISLYNAIINPLMNSDPRYMWVIPGQKVKVFENLLTDSCDSITYVVKSRKQDNHYSIGVVIMGVPYIKEQSFSKDELEEAYPELFALMGQLIRLD